MTHKERWRLAEDVCARMAAKHPEIIVGGVYGSTAWGTDTPWSDLELLFVVQDESSLCSQHFIYHDTAVGYEVTKEGKLKYLLATPSVKWPFWMGVLHVLKVLCGDPEKVTEWLDLGTSVPEARFKKTLEEHLPGFVVESYGRIFSCRHRNDTRDITCAVLEVIFEMNTILCLLNQSWVTHDYYQGIKESFSFSRLPKGYKDLVSTLWSAHTTDEIVPLAEEVVTNFWNFLELEGIRNTNYQTVDELPL